MKNQFNENELLYIRKAITEKMDNDKKVMESWQNYKFEDIGNMKNMFANEQAFEIVKQEVIEEREKTIKIGDTMLEKIDNIMYGEEN